MIDCIFTIDYEIYGNGLGSLREHVYEPIERMIKIFQKWNLPFVTFVEVAELEKIEECRTDDTINDVKRQILDLHKEGFEIALHIHPQWYNASFNDGNWNLDYTEYNLCTLHRHRIAEILERAINYLQNTLNDPDFTPLSFRAGNWLLQPSETTAKVLAEAGIKIDSSVFKGGLQRIHRLDYRPALQNGYYWRFQSDVNLDDQNGVLIEIPTHTKMVPFWQMSTTKRIGSQFKIMKSSQSYSQRIMRLMDFCRFMYPQKLDFCHLKLDDLIAMVENVIEEDKSNPTAYRPLVVIGHTKDLVDIDTVDSFLSYLINKDINVTTFRKAYEKCCNVA